MSHQTMNWILGAQCAGKRTVGTPHRDHQTNDVITLSIKYFETSTPN